MLIKALQYAAKGLIIFILISYIYLDITMNGSTITNQIQVNIIDAYEWVDGIELTPKQSPL